MEILTAVAGAAVSALVTVFREEIKGLVLFWRADRYSLKRRWTGTWKVDHGGPEEEIPDILEIRSILGGKIRGTGHSGYGDYKATGQFYPNSGLLQMNFRPAEKEKTGLGGVAILGASATARELEGYWFEYNDQREFHGGKVHLTATPAT